VETSNVLVGVMAKISTFVIHDFLTKPRAWMNSEMSEIHS